MNQRPWEVLFPTSAAMKDMCLCPNCGVGVSETDFRDELSRREWAITGLCQVCQDWVFGDENEVW